MTAHCRALAGRAMTARTLPADSTVSTPNSVRSTQPPSAKVQIVGNEHAGDRGPLRDVLAIADRRQVNVDRRRGSGVPALKLGRLSDQNDVWLTRARSVS